MTHLRTFGRFWYDFVIGDDWRLALGVSVSLAVVFTVTHAGMNAWWLLPVSVAVLLAVSLDNATRPRRR
jgi:hypothetical protein